MVSVTGAGGVVKSSEVSLVVNPLTAIICLPSTITVCNGLSVPLTAMAS